MYTRIRPRSSRTRNPDPIAKVRSLRREERFGEYRDQLLLANNEAASDPSQTKKFLDALADLAVDPNNLMQALKALRGTRGQAPGPNGLRYRDLDGWKVCKILSESLKKEHYQPYAPRRVKIPKSSGKGDRILQLPNVEDRIVQLGLLQVIEEFVDRQFEPTSYAFRPRRGRFDALAQAAQLTEAMGRRVWVTEDIRDAFTHVNRGLLGKAIAAYLPNPRLRELIRLAIRFPDAPGLIQGASLSPILLNMQLDHHLAKQWQLIHPRTPLLRFADDLAILCESHAEAQACHDTLSRLVTRLGMTLKGSPETAICDLGSGEATTWLGFELALVDGRLRCSLTDRLWRQLSDELALAHVHDDAALWALEVVYGWLGQLGPLMEDRELALPIYQGVRERMAEQGLDAPAEPEARAKMIDAYRSWRGVQERQRC